VGALPDTTEMPEKLPNPNPLTFTGAVSATYDGSTPVTVEIPESGGGGGLSLPLLYEVTTTEEVRWIDTGDNAFSANHMLIIELWSTYTTSNEKETAAISVSTYHTTNGASGLKPWSRPWAMANGTQSNSVNRWFRAIGHHADSGPWFVCSHTLNPNNNSVLTTTYEAKNLNADQSAPITGICIGNNAANYPSYFGIGTTLKIWGC
jgi:hypothetical protein